MDADVMVGFGPKQAWLAIRDTDPDAVMAALDLRDLGPVRWRLGVDLAHLSDDRVAVTPPLPGTHGGHWVLVLGRWYFASDAGPSVSALSDRLDTEVQFFSTYRVRERHRWERAVDGVLVRAFEYAGDSGTVTLWWGDPDDNERELGLPEVEPGGDEFDLLLDETDVLRLAGEWSIDPSTLDGLPAVGSLHSAAVQAEPA